MRAASSGRTWLALLAWLIIGAAALWAVTVLLILYTGARPVLRFADAILVLGAAQYNGRPSPVLKARLDHALELYDRGLAHKLVFTGGVGAGDTLGVGRAGSPAVAARGVDGAGPVALSDPDFSAAAPARAGSGGFRVATGFEETTGFSGSGAFCVATGLGGSGFGVTTGFSGSAAFSVTAGLAGSGTFGGTVVFGARLVGDACLAA